VWGLPHGDVFHLGGGGPRRRAQGAAAGAEGPDGGDAAAAHPRAAVLRPQATLAVRPTLRGLVRPGAGISCWAWAAAGERLTLPLTVGVELRKRRSAQR